MPKPDYFLCIAEKSDAERKDRKKSYPVRVAGVWEGEKGQLRCGRPKLNVLITRNTEIVLFPNAEEVDDEPEHEDIPF